MMILYGARCARPDLLRAIAGLARKVTRWRRMQDFQLHRLVSYLHTSLSFRQYGWVGAGDTAADLRLNLFADADLASDIEDSVSTSGAYLALVGPNSHMPLAQQSKKQTAVSHSSAEAEIVAADHALRTIGLPALDIWELILGKTGSLNIDMFEDNDACITIFRAGRNPNMRHIGRTHRISIAWLYERLKGPDVDMFRADSELMAADIFTKPFPLSLIHI